MFFGYSMEKLVPRGSRSCGSCGVGKWLEGWKEQTYSKCSRCLTANETVDHVIHCQHNDATLCWDQGREEIK